MDRGLQNVFGIVFKTKALPDATLLFIWDWDWFCGFKLSALVCLFIYLNK